MLIILIIVIVIIKKYTYIIATKYAFVQYNIMYVQSIFINILPCWIFIYLYIYYSIYS